MSEPPVNTYLHGVVTNYLGRLCVNLRAPTSMVRGMFQSDVKFLKIVVLVRIDTHVHIPGGDVHKYWGRHCLNLQLAHTYKASPTKTGKDFV